MRKYQIDHPVGNGNFSSVFKGFVMPDRTPCAIKIMKTHQNIAARQAQLLKKIKHPNVVSIIDFQQLEGESRLILQFVGMNTLQLYEAQSYGLREEQVKCILFQAALGLSCVHSLGIIHRDIKPENILIDKKSAIVKLIDFGLSIDQNKCSTDYIATRWYRSPENLLGTRQYNCAIDVFSLGCVIVELYLGSPLFPGSNNMDQIHKIFNILGYPTQESWPKGYQRMRDLNIIASSKQKQAEIDLKSIMNPCDARLIDIVSKMLELNPKKRITCTDILKHEYFRDVRLIVPPPVYQRFQQDIVSYKGSYFKNLNAVKSAKNINSYSQVNNNKKPCKLVTLPVNQQTKQIFNQSKNIESPQFLRHKKSSSLESKRVTKDEAEKIKNVQLKQKVFNIQNTLKRKTSTPSLFTHLPLQSPTNQTARIPSIFKDFKSKSPKDEDFKKELLAKNVNETILQENIQQMKRSSLTPDPSEATTISQISKIHVQTPSQIQGKPSPTFSQTENTRNKLYPLIPFAQFISEINDSANANQISSPKSVQPLPLLSVTSMSPVSQIQLINLSNHTYEKQPKSQINISSKPEISKEERKLSNLLPGQHPISKVYQHFQVQKKIQKKVENIQKKKQLFQQSFNFHIAQQTSPRQKYVSPSHRNLMNEGCVKNEVNSKVTHHQQLSGRQVVNPSYRYFPTSPETKLGLDRRRLVTINSPGLEFISPSHRKS